MMIVRVGEIEAVARAIMAASFGPGELSQGAIDIDWDCYASQARAAIDAYKTWLSFQSNSVARLIETQTQTRKDKS